MTELYVSASGPVHTYIDIIENTTVGGDPVGFCCFSSETADMFFPGFITAIAVIQLGLNLRLLRLLTFSFSSA